jgi:hypothetical protein
MKQPVQVEYGADGQWQSTGIDYADYARMSVHQHKLAPSRRLETPSWAVNDSQLRELLVAFMEERAFYRAGVRDGTLAERLANAQKKIIADCAELTKTIDRLCARFVELKRTVPFTPEIAKQATRLSRQIETLDTRLRFESKDGGVAMICGVIYKYYRLGMDSVGVGKELFIKPPHCRQILWRLSKTWERLHPTLKPEPTGRHRHALQHHVAALEKLAAANAGRIPSTRWLCANGYEASYDCLRGYPGAFAHLKRAPRERTGPPRVKPVRTATELSAAIDARRVKPEDAARALALYKSGLRGASIADVLGVNRHSRIDHVRRLLKSVGVVLPRQRMGVAPKWNVAQQEQIVRLYNSGSTIKALGAQFGYVHRIRVLLKAAGVYQPHRDKPRRKIAVKGMPVEPRAFREQVLNFYKPGMAIADVAVHFGYRRGTGCNRVRGVLVRARRYQLKQKPHQGGAAVVADRTISSGAPAHHPAI